MRLTKQGFSLSTTYSLRTEDRTHHLTVWEQPLHRWLIAEIYHWYDMRVYRLPGFRALERLLDKLHRGDMLYVPLGCRQDIRCYHLEQKQRTVLATLDISTEDYEGIMTKARSTP